MGETKKRTQERVKGKSTLYLYLPASLVDKLKKMAEAETRTLSGMARDALEKYLGVGKR